MWGFRSGVGQVSLLTASFTWLLVCIACDFMSVHLNRTIPGPDNLQKKCPKPKSITSVSVKWDKELSSRAPLGSVPCLRSWTSFVNGWNTSCASKTLSRTESVMMPRRETRWGAVTHKQRRRRDSHVPEYRWVQWAVTVDVFVWDCVMYNSQDVCKERSLWFLALKRYNRKLNVFALVSFLSTQPEVKVTMSLNPH